MCGIAGIFSQKLSKETLVNIASNMAQTLHHRGPDAKGVWSCESVGFGHARLAIVDLSAQGLQPMSSACGRYTICFNGEIYNYLELGEKLQQRSIALRGNSDTEVLIESISEFGLENALRAARGMFAFGLWDAKHKRITLGRDRLGEKPLYYGMCNGDLVFASELKAFRELPGFSASVDRSALSAFVKYKYVPTPACILKGYKKLPAATTIAGRNAAEVYESEPDAYWKYDEARVEYATVDGLEELLLSTIEKEMRSDVPIGCFLSGGIDSSLVTSLMQSLSENPIHTFTIGFSEKDFDESVHARNVATHLGTKHTEWIIGENDVLDLVQELPKIYDEPFGDSSQLPTTLLSRMTRKNVTVCLSGDGGDELFCGYSRYFWAQKVKNSLGKVPSPIRRAVARAIDLRSPDQWSAYYNKLPRFLGGNRINNFGNKLEPISRFCADANDEELYDFFLADWKQPQDLVVGGQNISIVKGSFGRNRSFMENMMLNDSKYYLSDDIMVKVDRASMSASLESRAPLLDHKVFEYAMSIPIDQKYSDGVGKLPLRNILYKYVPQQIIDRPKMGFGVPLDQWFRSELRDWCDDLLSAETLKRQGYFNVDEVVKCWNSHRSGKANRQYELWSILTFQQWLSDWGH